MDVLKATLYLLFVSVSINLIAGMLPYIGIIPTYTGGTLVGDPAPDGLVESYTGVDQQFYDVGTGLWAWWNMANMLIQGFPAMLEAFGAPTWLTEPLYWFYRLLWMTAVALGVIAGRTT